MCRVEKNLFARNVLLARTFIPASATTTSSRTRCTRYQREEVRRLFALLEYFLFLSRFIAEIALFGLRSRKRFGRAISRSLLLSFFFFGRKNRRISIPRNIDNRNSRAHSPWQGERDAADRRRDGRRTVDDVP